MKRSSAKLLQTVIVIFGIAVFVFLLWEPHVEGRNAHATLYEMYFNDTLLALAYGASIPFFVALYQAFRLFGDAGRHGEFSRHSVGALRILRFCAVVMLGFITAGVAYLFVVVRGQDDIAGGVAMGTVAAAFCTAMAIAAALFERTLQTRQR